MIDAVRIEDVLRDEGVFVSTTSGVSMYPMLRDRRDTIVVRPLKEGERLKKLDVPLYKRGEKYVLHRIIGVKGDEYVIRGDNTFMKEYVRKDAVIGVLVSFTRKGKKHTTEELGYKFYSRFWNFIYPLRTFKRKLRALASKIYHKLFKGKRK